MRSMACGRSSVVWYVGDRSPHAQTWLRRPNKTLAVNGRRRLTRLCTELASNRDQVEKAPGSPEIPLYGLFCRQKGTTHA